MTGGARGVPVAPATAEPATVLNRQARAALASVSLKSRPRCFVVGPAGSGKSALLQLCARALRESGRRIHRLTGDTDPSKIPTADVLLVDDLQLLDDARLASILARASDPRSGLVVAMRPWPRPDLTAEIARLLDREDPPVVLGQVARSDVLEHLDDAGARLADACLSQILALTGGLTWLVTHALAAHDDRDCTHDPHHDALRHAVEAQVAHRLDTLPESLRRGIEHLCVAPEDAPGPPASAFGSTEVVERGHAEGLLLRNGSTVPVVRAAARSVMPAHRAQEIAQPVSPDDLVVRQALDAWSASDLTTAAALVESLPPGATVSSPEAVRSLTASIWAARDMMATASDIFAALPPAPGAAAAAHATVTHAGSGRADRLQQAGPTDAAAASAPNTAHIAMQLLDRGLRASLERDAPPGALTDLVRAAELHLSAGPDEPHPEVPAVIAALVALGQGRSTTAEQVIDAAVAATPGTSWARRRLLLWQAWLAMNAERPADARASFAAAERVPGSVSPRDTLLLESVRVGMARRYDTLAALEAVWRDAADRVRHLDADLYTALPMTTLLTCAARVGDAATLAPQATRMLAILDGLGSPTTWAVHVWWAGIQQGILLNEPDRLAPHARALVAAAGAHPLAAILARAGGVWVAVLAGSVDADAIEAAARDLAAHGLAWDGARLAGHGSRRAEDRRVVTRLLSVARELHPRESAARAEDARSGGSSAPATGVLSQREWDVAVLVLEGKTYTEIGASIFISPKTVEHHVAHIRRRIGATSRSDLMSKLRVLVDEGRDASP